MKHKPASSVLTLVSCLLFLSLFSPGRLIAQEKGPVFWTRGGNWGNWLKISNYPGLAIRTACGDDSTLNNYPVSSTDWQLRNGYVEPMAVVWRVQFFDDSVGKNKMSGWMLEHFKPGEVSDGWSVEAGHCKARNVISVQVKCAVRDGDEAKCYNSDGNPYPPRPDGAFSGDHNPNAQATASDSRSGPAKDAASFDYWICSASDGGHNYFTQIFHFPYTGDKVEAAALKYQDTTMSPQFNAWFDTFPGKYPGLKGECRFFADKAQAEAFLQYWSNNPNSRRQNVTLDWTPTTPQPH